MTRKQLLAEAVAWETIAERASRHPKGLHVLGAFGAWTLGMSVRFLDHYEMGTRGLRGANGIAIWDSTLFALECRDEARGAK